MPAPVVTSPTPFSVPAGETDLSAPVNGVVTIDVAIRITGTVGQVQADWATLAATVLSAPSSILSGVEL